MAAKFLHNLTEDSSADFQKQMGCMTGILQLFDRQNMLTGGGRRIVGLASETNPGIRRSCARNSEGQGSEQVKSASFEKGHMKNMPEKQRIPVEISFSSSSQSSFSSRDCVRAESTSFDRLIFPENHSREPEMVAQQIPDIRDFVKDSMHRELQGAKAKASEEYQYHGSKLDKKPSTPADVKQSLRVLAEFRDGAQHENCRSSSNDVSSFSMSGDAPRRSYDGREVSLDLYDSYDVSKDSIIVKDRPRHSFDSGEVSSSSLKSMDIDTCSGKVAQIQLQRSRSEARLPSVIAKLMGLETLPDTVSSIDSVEESISTTNSMDPTQVVPSSYQISCKEPLSTGWRRNSDSSTASSVRFPNEPAPWKHADRMKNSQKQAPRSVQFPSRALSGIPSVYSEIDKRLEDLLQSGNSLTALKHIMGTTEAKVLMEMSNGQPNFSSDKDLEQRSRKREADNFDSPARRNSVSPQNHGSPIVIMRPAKYVEKHELHPAHRISLDGVPRMIRISSYGSDYNRRNLGRARTSRERGNDVNLNRQKGGRSLKPQASVKSHSHQLPKDGNMGLGKNSSSLSPRMLPKNTEMEKRSFPPTPPDSRRPRKHPNKKNVEMNSSARRQRTKPPNLKQSDIQSRNISSCDAEVSAQYCDTTSTSNSKHDEMIASEVSPTLATGHSPRTMSPERVFSVFADKETAVASSEDSAESGSVPPEYPSPISILDSRMHQLDNSPVKHAVMSLKEDASIGDEENPDLVLESNSKEAVAEFDFNEEKLQNIENLVQKLRRLSSSCDEARTDYIASLCESSNPDHHYISEILLASGLLLRALTDFHFHPSGHPINPELFLVLEQTKGNTSPQGHTAKKTSQLTTEKNHRKLIFDTVNEILAKKLASSNSNSKPWSRSVCSAEKRMTSQMILRSLCLEVESLQAKTSKHGSDNRDEEWRNIITSDIMMHHPSGRWMDKEKKLSGAVLDIERMIFKDLVNEIVTGESSCSVNTQQRKDYVP